MDVHYVITDATASALATAAVLVVACVAALGVLIAPGRPNDPVAHTAANRRTAPLLAVRAECQTCRARYRCTGRDRAKAANCPRCGGSLITDRNESGNVPSS